MFQINRSDTSLHISRPPNQTRSYCVRPGVCKVLFISHIFPFKSLYCFSLNSVWIAEKQMVGFNIFDQTNPKQKFCLKWNKRQIIEKEVCYIYNYLYNKPILLIIHERLYYPFSFSLQTMLSGWFITFTPYCIDVKSNTYIQHILASTLYIQNTKNYLHPPYIVSDLILKY